RAVRQRCVEREGALRGGLQPARRALRPDDMVRRQLLTTARSFAALGIAMLVAASGAEAVSSRPGAQTTVPRPRIVVKPIPFGPARRAETTAYAKRHYAMNTWRLVHPRVIVEHYTASNTFASTYAAFASNAPNLGELPGVCAHFVVDRDGTVYRLVP